MLIKGYILLLFIHLVQSDLNAEGKYLTLDKVGHFTIK